MNRVATKPFPHGLGSQGASPIIFLAGIKSVLATAEHIGVR